MSIETDARFEDAAVVVTGAASGIGRATATVFGERGADLALLDVDGDALEDVRTDVAGDGTRVETFTVDVTEAEQLRAAFDEAADRLGGIDVCHNNAGRFHDPAPVTAVPESTWDRVIDVNLKGVFLGAKFAVPYLRDGGGGAIVNTASVNAFRPRRDIAPYAASKGGVVTLTKQLATELAPDDIRVNAVCPGTTDTPILSRFEADTGDDDPSRAEIAESIPLGRVVEPREVGTAVAYLASSEAAMITGTTLSVDGGQLL